jgi:hypothetical protein
VLSMQQQALAAAEKAVGQSTGDRSEATAPDVNKSNNAGDR